MGATPTGPTLDPLNILVYKFNIATHVALILFLFRSWINYLLYDTKSVMVFWQLLSKIKRFVTIFRISWNGPTLFNIPIGDFPPSMSECMVTRSPSIGLTNLAKPYHVHYHLSQPDMAGDRADALGGLLRGPRAPPSRSQGTGASSTWFSGYACRTTVISGTLKDGSLEINSLALNNYFGYRNVFQNGINVWLKTLTKN